MVVRRRGTPSTLRIDGSWTTAIETEGEGAQGSGEAAWQGTGGEEGLRMARSHQLLVMAVLLVGTLALE